MINTLFYSTNFVLSSLSRYSSQSFFFKFISTAVAVLNRTVIPEIIAVLALIASSLSTTNPEHDYDLLEFLSDSDSDAGGGYQQLSLGSSDSTALILYIFWYSGRTLI
jgi:hypothetical protein